MVAAARILIVDDEPLNRDYLQQELEDLGFEVVTASSGQEALDTVAASPPDLVLLDVLMPGLDGIDVCRILKADVQTQLIPVVIMTALDSTEDRIRGIEAGADDFLTKPVDDRELLARIGTSLRMKRAVDGTVDQVRPAQADAKSEGIVDHYDDVTVLVASIVNDTPLTTGVSPGEVIEVLDRLYRQFDVLTDERGLRRIRTGGDRHLVIGGAPASSGDPGDAARLALDMLLAVDQVEIGGAARLALRVGIDVGSVVAGVTGEPKLAYHVLGDAVNIAGRMESTSLPGRIQVSERAYERLRQAFLLVPRGSVEIEGKGALVTYFLEAAATD